uniref:Uncharacterized protein n=1 Tax=Steinernema glaseri TaxID=37863 RepID=A0A1I7ZIF3_9BILA
MPRAASSLPLAEISGGEQLMGLLPCRLHTDEQEEASDGPGRRIDRLHGITGQSCDVRVPVDARAIDAFGRAAQEFFPRASSTGLRTDAVGCLPSLPRSRRSADRTAQVEMFSASVDFRPHRVLACCSLQGPR